ncbi:60S ribosomal protein L6B (nucleomorph) [Guillardia theta]|uniref:60S ribosomal protein L6B n=1 Tax=Guillardia theta TaxID=55529 RepID=Q98RL7_GUITH|nr:60S ribosomal protein L6B [Guillardia theta]AAK39931.1 60S ribosomal protein L6B [Guillardia theta]
MFPFSKRSTWIEKVEFLSSNNTNNSIKQKKNKSEKKLANKDFKIGDILIIKKRNNYGKKCVFLGHTDDGNLLLSGIMKFNGIGYLKIHWKYVVKSGVSLKGLNFLTKHTNKDYLEELKKSKHYSNTVLTNKIAKKNIFYSEELQKRLLNKIKKKALLISYFRTKTFFKS